MRVNCGVHSKRHNEQQPKLVNSDMSGDHHHHINGRVLHWQRASTCPAAPLTAAYTWQCAHTGTCISQYDQYIDVSQHHSNAKQGYHTPEIHTFRSHDLRNTSYSRVTDTCWPTPDNAASWHFPYVHMSYQQL